MTKAAVISPCGAYRFILSREETPLFESNGTVLFGLNNPSKADSEIDDQTVRKGWSYTRAWGYHRMVFVNTNPYRSTDPDSAIVPPEEVLTENDGYLRSAAEKADLVICAWGVKAKPELAARAASILRGQKPLHFIKLSKDGIPMHPLYQKGDIMPLPWDAN